MDHAYVIQLKENEFVSNARSSKLTQTINSVADVHSAKKFKNKADAAAFIKKYDMHLVFDYFTTLLVKKSGQIWIKA